MAKSVKSMERQVFTIVASIPEAKVATYGQIARMAGHPNHTRLVGRILSRLPESTSLPWHRVISSGGRINHPAAHSQQKKLKEEGITLVNNKINLRLFSWFPL